MARTGFTAPGQREVIARGERTDPRVIIGQALAWGLCGCAILLFVIGGILINRLDRMRYVLRYVGANWRWLLFVVAAPLAIGALLALVVLTIEICDPNWPPPRDATKSTRPLWPHSRERADPPAEVTNVNIRLGLSDLLTMLDRDEDDDELD